MIETILWIIFIAYVLYFISVVVYLLTLPANNPKSFLKNKEIACPGRKRIVVIGDSITHGNVSANYVQMLGDRLRKRDGKLFDIINAGINSDFAWNVLQRLEDVIEIGRAHV
jgi:lysophospholipase L1-like esterase